MMISTRCSASLSRLGYLVLGTSSIIGGQSLQMPMGSRALSFSTNWQILGPFQIGTREAVWGIDPLERFGGISNISRDTSFLRSSLTTNASVMWFDHHAHRETPSTELSDVVQLHVDFSNVQWGPLQKPYGWPSIQYTAWARGVLHIQTSGPSIVALQFQGVLEFNVDGQRHFGGDLFSFRRAPLVLELAPGDHVVEVRLVRDVRAFGGNDHAIDVQLEARVMEGLVSIIEGSLLTSDVVDGRMASPYATLAVVNNGKSTIVITGVRLSKESPASSDVIIRGPDEFVLQPGQTRSYIFSIAGSLIGIHELPLVLHFETEGNDDSTLQQHANDHKGEFNVLVRLEHKSIFETHKVTHRHPSGIISYAMVRPPSMKAVRAAKRKSAPVLLVLHGAGVEASDKIAAGALDDLPDLPAFVVSPTGVTKWSSDDWHSWGFADVEAAITNLKAWQKSVNYTSLDVDITSWLVSGHSNGGQGTWYAATHYPDKIIGAAPISGYTSIQNYVPYNFWSPMDPHKHAIIEAAANNYRHELLTSNLAGIEICQQHGEADDNVPPYHSRFMNVLIARDGGYRPELVELAGNQSGHWFEGVMTTPGLSDFFRGKLQDHQNGKNISLARDEGHDISYTITVGNPTEMGPKGGIQVLQLRDPGRLGRVTVHFDAEDELWSLRTSNVAALRIINRKASGLSVSRNEFMVDDYGFILEPSLELGDVDLVVFNGAWKIGSIPKTSRQSQQYGGLQAILHTTAPFSIIHSPLEEEKAIAGQISRNLQTYYQADAVIVPYRYQIHHSKGSNRITVARDIDMIMSSAPKKFPITFTRDKFDNPILEIIDPFEKESIRLFAGSTGNKLGAIFIRPIFADIEASVAYDTNGQLKEGSDLELVIWGSDADMLGWASRFAPTITGVGQPDFIIFTDRMKWEGAGCTILGFFDSNWKIARSSAMEVDPSVGFRRV